MKFLSLAIFLISLVLVPLSCGVEKDEIGYGCTADADCAGERVCVDHVCRYSEDAESISPAERTALIVFQSLKEQTITHFDLALPLLEDYGWGFDLSGDGLYNEQQLAFMNEHRDGLYADYDKLLENMDLSAAEYVGFSPGAYQTIPEGQQRAARNLESLINSRITYQVDGESKNITITRLVRLRDRWCLFDLTP